MFGIVRTNQCAKVFAHFCGHARTNMRKFWSSFFKSGAFRLRKAIKRRVALVALRVRAKCPRTVCTERCKYPVSALAERGCKSARDIGGQCHLCFKYAVTICTVRSFLQSFFFGLLSQRKSVKGSSGSKPSLKNVQLGCRGGVGHFIIFMRI